MKTLVVGSLLVLSLAATVERTDAVPSVGVLDVTVDVRTGILGFRQALGSVTANLALTPFSSSDFTSLGGGFADLATGTLGARAFMDATDPYINRRVDAEFGDTIIPLASGLMHFDIALSGTLAGDAFGRLEVKGAELVEFLAGPKEEEFFLFPGQPLSFDFPVTMNVPLPFGLELIALAGFHPVWLPVGQDGDANLLNTATVAISGIPFTSDSGVFLTGASVTEPSTLLLLGAGLGALIAGKRCCRDERKGPT